MEFAEILKAFVEVGVLGCCAVLVILMLYNNHKHNERRLDKKDDREDKGEELIQKELKDLIDVISDQNKIFQEQQAKNMDLMMQKIIDGVVTHTITPEENKKLAEVTSEIDNILLDIIRETGASRACLVQYHNGGRGINKQSFLKMSMTNEQVQLGVQPIIGSFKDIFRSTLAYFVKELDNTGRCYINNSDELKDKDISMYEFLSNRGVQAKYGLAIRNKEKSMNIGFICIEFNNKNCVDIEK